MLTESRTRTRPLVFKHESSFLGLIQVPKCSFRLYGISGSGNSENVLRAIRYANENGGKTLGICGYDGGKLKNLAHHALWIDVDDMQLSEDLHLILNH